MRQIILDIETTGLEPSEGHRIIEIGCLELINRRLTEKRWHEYLNPERNIETGAAAVHGITNEFLADKPLFSNIVDSLINFIKGAELIIHNAPFDLSFLNHELRLINQNLGKIEDICQIIDTLPLARKLHPGQKNSLDALCKRYNIDNSHRNLHGALLDAELLFEVYLAMTGGQVSLSLEPHHKLAANYVDNPLRIANNRPRLLIIHPNPEEEALHQEYLLALDKASGGNCLWLRCN